MTIQDERTPCHAPETCEQPIPKENLDSFPGKELKLEPKPTEPKATTSLRKQKEPRGPQIMEPRAIPSLSKRHRRSSCPAFSLGVPEMHHHSTTKPTVKSAKPKTSVTLFPVDNLQYPMPKLSERLSPSSDNLVKPLLSKQHHNGILKHEPSLHGLRHEQHITFSSDVAGKPTSRLNDISKSEVDPQDTGLERHPTAVSIDSDTVSVSSFKQGLRSMDGKNEAEIIDEPPGPGRRSSLPSLFGHGRQSVAFPGSTSTPGQVQARRKGSVSDSVDRELQSLYKNSVEDRRLMHAINELDRQSFAGILDFRHKKNALFKEYRQLHNTSPDADDWLRLRKSRTNTLQQREREDIARRYSRRSRYFRAPPELQETVDKIRSYAMVKAGLLHTEETEMKSDEDDIDEEVANLTSVRMASRRHTISGDFRVGNLSKGSRQQPSAAATAAKLHGRRMTLADIKTFQEVLEFKARHLSPVYVDAQGRDNDGDDNDDEEEEEEENLAIQGDESESNVFCDETEPSAHDGDIKCAVRMHDVEGNKKAISAEHKAEMAATSSSSCDSMKSEEDVEDKMSEENESDG